ncbi:MAG: DUF4416 family protein [Planctomycetes bacterium]|nr:DUF4416 family protein [Planctomycetota bacterium]
MGQVYPHPPVFPILAAFSRYELALAWTRERAAAEWGPIALASEPFAFDDTAYYEREMGEGLQKVFFAFERLIDPAELINRKLASNRWEDEYRAASNLPAPRPLNLDPGYLTEAKLVLATTKDRDHRIYLDRGIFAEVTLHFHKGQWRPREWTYPDYRRSEYHRFFTRCRDYYRGRRS